MKSLSFSKTHNSGHSRLHKILETRKDEASLLYGGVK